MIDTFDKSGVIILRGAVDPAACDRLKERALELVADVDPATAEHVFSTLTDEQADDRYFLESGDKIRFFVEASAFDDDGRLSRPVEHSLNKMGHAMHDLDPVFDAFSHTPLLDGIAASLGQADPVIVQSMYIFKPPFIGGEVTCHQDSTFIYTEPETCLGFWFALEDATLDNGCMHFIPGAHRATLKERHFRQPDGAYRTIQQAEPGWSEADALPAEAMKGDLVVFHGRAPHRSAANTSPNSRHAFTLHAIDRQAHYPADNWLQRSADLPLRGFKG